MTRAHRSVRMLLSTVLMAGLLLVSACSTQPAAPASQPSQPAAPASQPAAPAAPAQQPAAPAQPAAQPVTADLKWGTISAGGAWQVVGAAMLEDIKQDNPGITGSILPSGTTANVIGVNEGKFNIAFTLTDATAQAWDGEGEFEKTGPIQDLRTIARLYPHGTQIVVWADSGINKVEDLKGKRISPGGRGLSNHIEGARIMQEYGIDWDNDLKVEYLSFNDAAQNMIDGHLDALFYPTTPFPFATILNVAARKPIKLLPLDQKVVDAMVQKYKGVEALDFPAGIYPGQDQALTGIGVRSHLFVHKDMPDDVVYAMVKTIYNNFDRYGDVIGVMKWAQKDGLAGDTGLPYHPGAEKFYKEVGLIK